MIRTRQAFLFLCLSVLCLPDLVQAQTATPARIGSWNIEWLGSPARRSSRDAQKPEDLATYIRESKVDLLCLNEITADGDTAMTSKTLTETFAKIQEQTEQKWEHVLFPKEDGNDRQQLCGVAWNTKRVQMVGEPMRVPIRRGKGSRIWNRHPWAAKFSFGESKTDVVVVPIHMKSNVGGEDTVTQRRDEGRALVRLLGAIQNQFKDDDVLLLGDFNCLKADEVAMKTYAGAGFVDLNAQDKHSWIKSDRYDYAPFDRILIPDDQPEFKECRLTVLSKEPGDPEKTFRQKLSDHYMVVTEFSIVDDDD